MSGVMAGLAAFLLIGGWLVSFVGSIIVLAAAFRVSTKWGLLCIVPFGGLFFLYHHWEEAKPGVKVILGSWVMTACGLAIGFGVAVNAPPAPAMAETKPAAPVKREAKLLSSITFDEGTSYAAPVAEPIEEKAVAPIIEQVYADNGSRMYWTNDCQSRPENAFRISKTLALAQQYTAATCADPVKPKKKKRR